MNKTPREYIGGEIKVIKVSDTQIVLDVSGTYQGDPIFLSDSAPVVGTITFNRFTKTF